MKGQGHSRWNKKIEKYTYGLAMVAMVLFFIWLCSWVGLQRPSEIQAFSIRVHKILAKLKLKWATAFTRWPASNRGWDRRTVDIKVHQRLLQGYVFNAKKFPGAASKIRQSSFCLYVLLIVQHTYNSLLLSIWIESRNLFYLFFFQLSAYYLTIFDSDDWKKSSLL